MILQADLVRLNVDITLNDGLLEEYCAKLRLWVAKQLSMSVLLVLISEDVYFYRPQRSCGQGYVFTRVCDSVHRGGSPGRHPPDQGEPPNQADPPGRDNPPSDQADTPPDQADPPQPGRPPRTRQTPPGTRQTSPQQGEPPLGPGRPPPPEEDCSIRSMSGRYASYWNAFLFSSRFLGHNLMKDFLVALFNWSKVYWQYISVQWIRSSCHKMLSGK